MATTKRITYRYADLLKFAPIIGEAAALWAKCCAEFMASRGDEGTCVIGAGIVIDYLPPRCRNPVSRRIIDVPSTAGQGASTWEASVNEVIAFLALRGIEAHYNPGRMD